MDWGDEIDALHALLESQRVAVSAPHRRPRVFLRISTVENQLKNCPVCGSAHPEYQFSIHGRRLMRCVACDVMFAVLHFSSVGSAILQNSFIDGDTLLGNNFSENPSEGYLSKLQSAGSLTGRRILAEGRGSASFSQFALAQGLESVCAESGDFNDEPFDACVLLDVLGENAHPAEQLSRVHGLLDTDGLLLLSLPTLDSPEAHTQKIHWAQFRTHRVVYFDTHNLAALLVRTGFRDILTWPEPDGIVALCRKTDQAELDRQPRLSIVLPVYNERSTFDQLINTVLEKDFEGLELEIVIVESNSTDGSRELVKQYESCPGIKVVYEDKPRGKGYAVRNGLERISGDIVLIQDADLEYDVDDYDALLEPILFHHKLFVLGSRHKGNWKMRQFEDRKLLGTIFNFGQVFFTWLLNVTCGTRLKDPFTMYKVFHRECLYGLQLESNRFDLDWEIVIRFIRKGFVPSEIPVNYTSRSFSEGKKVRPLLDPMLWIVALVKFRYGPLYSQHSNKPSKP